MSEPELSEDSPMRDSTALRERFAKSNLMPRKPVTVTLSTFDLRMTTGTDDADTWAQMKALLIERGVPADRLEGKPNFRADETPDGLTLEFP